LIGYGSVKADPFQIAAYAAAHSERLGFMLAHRPGFVFPTLAARQFASLDQFSAGRLSVNFVSGASDVEQRREGDYLSKDDRYARTDEYIDVIRTLWSATEPVDHAGRFYAFEGYTNAVPPYEDRLPRIYVSGASQPAYEVAVKHADVFMQTGLPLAGIREQIAAVRSEAARQRRDRPIGFSASFHPILGVTEARAWERAHGLLAAVEQNIKKGPYGLMLKARGTGTNPPSVAAQRMWKAAQDSERHDRALWTALTRATGAFGSASALVGTPETVAAALLDYVDVGITAFQLYGYDGYGETVEYGRDLLPLLRQELLRREPAALAS
jgi:alkanesulfonate monooxygenase